MGSAAENQLGPICLEVDEDDPLATVRTLMLETRGVPTEHWLGVDTGAGVAGLVECLRVLTAECPATVPTLNEAPLLTLPDLDKICLETIEELLCNEESLGLSSDSVKSDAVTARSEALQDIAAQHVASVQEHLKRLRETSEVKRRWCARRLLDMDYSLDVACLVAPNAADLQDFVLQNRPVLLTNVRANMWPLQDIEWTDAHLVERCAPRMLRARLSHPENTNRASEQVSLAEYVATLREPKPRLYAARVPLKQLPELSAEAAAPSALAFSHLFGPPYFEGLIMYFGAGGQTTPLHFDEQENIIFVLRGKKHLKLYPPNQSANLYPREPPHHYFSQVPPTGDQSQFPNFTHARSFEVTVAAGEALYLPFGWWHSVRGSEETNLTLNYWYDIPVAKSELTDTNELRTSDVKRRKT